MSGAGAPSRWVFDISVPLGRTNSVPLLTNSYKRHMPNDRVIQLQYFEKKGGEGAL